MRSLKHRPGDDRTVLEHILEVDEVAVVHMLREIVGVMEVYDAFLMRLDNVRREKETVGQVARDLARHVVALGRVDDRVLVRVLLLCLLVVALDEREYLIVGGVRAADKVVRVAVGDIVLRDLEGSVRHYLVFDHVLYFLDAGGAAEALTGQHHALGDAVDLLAGQAYRLVDRDVRLADRSYYLVLIEFGFRAVAFDDLHYSSGPFRKCVFVP